MARSRRASSACLGGKHACATRLQWACLRSVSTSAFHRRNRARRETTIRPSISRNDADVTEIGRRGVSPDGAVPPVFFPRGGARGLAVFGRRVGLVQDGVEVLARGGVVLGDAAAAVGEEDAELERAPAVAELRAAAEQRERRELVRRVGACASARARAGVDARARAATAPSASRVDVGAPGRSRGRPPPKPPASARVGAVALGPHVRGVVGRAAVAGRREALEGRQRPAVVACAGVRGNDADVDGARARASVPRRGRSSDVGTRPAAGPEVRLCRKPPVEWIGPAKLQTSLSRSNRRRFG